MYQKRHKISNEHCDDYGIWLEWEECSLNNYNEVKRLIAGGYNYEVRELVVDHTDKTDLVIDVLYKSTVYQSERMAYMADAINLAITQLPYNIGGNPVMDLLYDAIGAQQLRGDESS